MILALITGVLLVQVVGLAKGRINNLATIARLNQQVEALSSKVNYFKTKERKEKDSRALRKFHENAYRLRYPQFTETVQVVYRKSKEFGFNPYLVMAVIQVESGFDQYAVSTAGAYGLMQVNYSVWKDELNIDLDRIFDKDYNVDLGLKILKHYYDRHSGNMFMALFRYNNGYKYNNTTYNGRILATKFYAHRDKAEERIPEGKENRSI